jgi:hypothetical protein
VIRISNPTVAIDDRIQQRCAEYGRKVGQVVRDAVESVANEAVDALKAEGGYGGKRYRKGFTAVQSAEYGLYGQGWVVGNKRHYMLTHLLERGHAKRGKAKGMTRAFPHFGPTEEKMAKLFEEEMAKALEDLPSNLS